MAPYQRQEVQPIEKAFVSEYKGNPTCTIPVGDKRLPFSFGARKAQAIVDNIEFIRMFAHDNPVE